MHGVIKMTGNGYQELENIKNELNNIINELAAVSDRIRQDFKNVGNTRCADSIDSVVEKYKSALKTLKSISSDDLDRAYSGGGRRG